MFDFLHLKIPQLFLTHFHYMMYFIFDSYTDRINIFHFSSDQCFIFFDMLNQGMNKGWLAWNILGSMGAISNLKYILLIGLV